MEKIKRGDIPLITWKRLQHLDHILSSGKLYNQKALADIVGVMPSTIRLDIIKMQELGVPVCTKIDYVDCLTYMETKRYLSKDMDIEIEEVKAPQIIRRPLPDSVAKKRREERKKEFRKR